MLGSRFAVADNGPFRRVATLLKRTAPAANIPPIDAAEAALARLARVL
jgi:hypothetical protein